MNFGNGITEIYSTTQALPMKCSSGSAQMRFTNCGNQVAENGRKKREKELWLQKSGVEFFFKKVLRSQYFYNIFHNKS